MTTALREPKHVAMICKIYVVYLTVSISKQIPIFSEGVLRVRIVMAIVHPLVCDNEVCRPLCFYVSGIF
jgi:hypothetical protein